LTGTQLNNLCVSDEDVCEAPRTETQRSSDQELSDARISLSDNQAQRSLDSADFLGKIGR
ncbi:hypothetical protein MKW94_025840, partial [Papaver nudicaule]|nr:hypothetical protein [Papaver nudicaule]